VVDTLATGGLAGDLGDVLRGKFVVFGDFDELFGSVDKEGIVVVLVLFQHHDAGGDGGAEEEVGRELDDAVDEVVVDEVATDLLLGTTTVHNAWEADDSGGAIGGQPAQRMHDESEVGL